MVLSVLPNEDAVDPEKVHVMTDQECLDERGFLIKGKIVTIRCRLSVDVIPHTDFHKEKASEMFGVPYDEVTPDQREVAKRKSFMEAYGNHGWPPELVAEFEKGN